ncbi:hypothetical protein NQ318_012524 [Aromia moschata]|uniref:Mos1 transposase HTH domain-containing protein n=1 Tax=Aromia moschata TaxID=1265417 RepID=A0AAV8XZ90_9CUCU|nr:hypothetical protein NQ318_012524 [Aromia moschata]
MAHLTVTQRIEILIFIRCGNKTRTQKEVCNLFNGKYLDNPITQSTITLSPNPQLVRLSPNLEKLVMLKIYQNQCVQKLPKIKRLTLC